MIITENDAVHNVVEGKNIENPKYKTRQEAWELFTNQF